MSPSAAASLPASMTAIAIRHPGAPEVLVPVRLPLPHPGRGELLVRVAAAGVNRPDVMQRRGSYPPPPGASPLPGLEFAGEVVGLGEGVERYRLGDAVCALVAGGGYAEYAVVHERNALPVPTPLTLAAAAALPETFFTVWANVFQRGRLQAGETMLVHGGTSGIGSVATLLGTAFGARVISTVGSADKRAASLALGAQAAILYRDEDFVAETLRLTGGRGADVIVDLLGGDYLPRNYQAAALDGRIVQIGIQHGKVRALDLMPLLAKRLTHTGSTLRARSVMEKAAIARALEQQVWPLLEQGRIKPQLDRCFPLAEAAQAHARMESSAHIGKIVLLTQAGAAR